MPTWLMDCDCGFSTLFQELSEAELEYLHSKMQCRSIAARSHVLAAGQQHHEVFLLATGQVKICVEDIALNILGPGEVLGELSVLDKCGHSADVWALEKCDLLCIEGQEFLSCLSSIPTLTKNLLRIEMRRLKQLSERFRICHTLPVPGRVAWQLSIFAGTYGQSNTEIDVVIPFSLAQADLAHLIGSSRESVNRVLCDFQNQRVISIGQYSRITIHNTQALKRLWK